MSGEPKRKPVYPLESQTAYREWKRQAFDGPIDPEYNEGYRRAFRAGFRAAVRAIQRELQEAAR